jgi:hypothetical protein
LFPSFAGINGHDRSDAPALPADPLFFKKKNWFSCPDAPPLFVIWKITKINVYGKVHAYFSWRQRQ